MEDGEHSQIQSITSNFGYLRDSEGRTSSQIGWLLVQDETLAHPSDVKGGDALTLSPTPLVAQYQPRANNAAGFVFICKGEEAN